VVEPGGKSNLVLGNISASSYFVIKQAFALRAGAAISSRQQKLYAGGTMIRNEVLASGGWWAQVWNRYLGLKFEINGNTHWGWARLTVRNRNGEDITATLTGYAYETVAYKGIIAGKTHGNDDDPVGKSAINQNGPRHATLGHLAAGIPALANSRQK